MEMITPRLSRCWELETAIANLRAEAVKVGVLIETKTKFANTHGLFKDVSEIHLIDPKSGRKASVFGTMALMSSSIAGAVEAEFARAWSSQLWALRKLLLDVHGDMVNEPDWGLLNLSARPKQVTLWKDGVASGRDMYAHGTVGYGGWLSDDDVLSPYRVVHYPSDFKVDSDFYTYEF